MTFGVSIFLLLCLLALAAYVDRVYFEMGKFLAREYTENIDAWEAGVEPRLKLSRESAALSASVLRQIALGALIFMLAMRIHHRVGGDPFELARTVFELVLVLLIFDRLLPQLIFTRTRGEWIARIGWLIRLLFYAILPLTLAIQLLLSIAGLAEPEITEPEHPNEAMDALLEAGEEEGVLDEEDRELVRSVVEFGDKVAREVMTPRPEVFAVPGTMTLEAFNAAVREHNFSRVPVYGASLDEITGIAFARDLLGIADTDATTKTVAELQRPALFIPETKKVNELLREMQRQKQHMGVVIDEYGGVAGIVTIEDLLETIVGEIEDEHDEAEIEDVPVAEPEGTWVVPGSFEVSRLRELFESEHGPSAAHAADAATSVEGGYEADDDAVDAAADAAAQAADEALAALLAGYEATTVGGLVSEMAGHIPLPGEVVEDGPLRLEVLASTDRLVERVRAGWSAAATETTEA